jgi:transcriptional regulator with XRE-family HTH domain
LEYEIAISFGRVLRRLRHNANLTQEGLAFAADVNRNYVSSLELGQKAASLEMVFKIAKALGIPPGEFVTLIEVDKDEIVSSITMTESIKP